MKKNKKLSKEIINDTLKFYYFLFLDEDSVLRYTKKTLQAIKGKLNSDFYSTDPQVLLIYFTHKYIKKIKNNWPHSHSVKSDYFEFDKSVNLGAWQEFKKQSQVEDLCSVIWSRVLLYDEQKISLGLKITQGAVLHRLSRGLKNLGKILRWEALNA